MARRVLKRTTKSKAKAGEKSAVVAYERDTPSAPVGVRDAGVIYAPSTTNRSVPATQAKNRFGEILQTARELGPVFIERHGQAQAVVLSIDTYNKLTSNERSSQERELDYWTREFQALHARMQTDEARQAVDALFSATDAELNRRGT